MVEISNVEHVHVALHYWAKHTVKAWSGDENGRRQLLRITDSIIRSLRAIGYKIFYSLLATHLYNS